MNTCLLPAVQRSVEKAASAKLPLGKRNELWNDYREYPSDDKFKRYKEIRNKVNKLVRQDHATHQNKILQGLKGNPKRFYAHLRGLQTVKAKVRQLKRNDGSTTASDEEAAAELCIGHSRRYSFRRSTTQPSL